PQLRAGGNFRIGANDQTPQNRVLRTYQLTDTLSWRKGAHGLRFGGEWEHFYGIGSWAFDEPATITLHDPVTVYTRAFPSGATGTATDIAIYNALPASLKVISCDGNKTYAALTSDRLASVANILRL